MAAMPQIRRAVAQEQNQPSPCGMQELLGLTGSSFGVAFPILEEFQSVVIIRAQSPGRDAAKGSLAFEQLLKLADCLFP